MLAMVAEFSESDLNRLRTREGMKVAKAKGRSRRKQPKLNHRLPCTPSASSGSSWQGRGPLSWDDHFLAFSAYGSSADSL